MFRSVRDLIGYIVQASDGDCGRCDDFLFDDQTWTIRYVVVDTGGFLARNDVLLSPFVFGGPQLSEHPDHIPVALTRQEIESSPELDREAPVSRQFERALAKYYGHPYYWVGSELWGDTPYPRPPNPDGGEARSDEIEDVRRGHLRSAKDLMDYQVESHDASIGQISDLIIETAPWRIRHLVVEARSDFPQKRVLFSPAWIKELRMGDRSIHLADIAESVVKNAPGFDPHAGVNRDYEGRLFDYYGRPRYW